MAGDLVSTVYGPISARFAGAALDALCVPDGGVQTGPFGSQLHASDYVEYGTPIITVEHLGENRIIHTNLPRVTDEDKERLARYTLIPGDIVFSRVGSVDRRAIVHAEEDGWLFSGRCLRVRPDRKKIDPGFLSWFFGLPGFQEHIRQIAVGATMPSLNTKILGDVPIYCPPSLKEQQAIACVLGALDDKIELNRRMNRTLEETARAIFKSWFVDFDPVRTKAAGQQPPGLKPEIVALFPDSFVESELGEIPKGWNASTIGQHFRLTMGQSPPGSTYNEIGEGLPFYQGRTDFGFRFPTRRVFCTAPTRFAEPGDTLVSVRAPVGDVNIASERCAVGRGVAAIRHYTGGRSFTYHSMHHLGNHFNKFEAEGTVFGSISKKDFERLPFVAPPIEILSAFDRIVSPLDDRIETGERQTFILASIRDALLPKLISGELLVLEIKRIVGRYV